MLKKLLALGTAAALVAAAITACGAAAAGDATVIRLSDDGVTVDGKAASADAAAAVYTAHDIVYYEAGKGFTYGEGGEADEHTPEEAAAHTVVHITQPGTYSLSGKLSAGQIAVDLGEDAEENPEAVVTLILNGVDITCTVAPAVIFYHVYECGSTDADTAVKDVDTSAAGANVVIADGTENHVTGSYVARIYKSYTLSEDGQSVVDNKKLHKYDGAFYSKMSMNVDGGEKGTGVLTIDAENEGLDAELHLTINGGNINIRSGNDGINTNEDGVSVTTINGGTLTIDVDGATGEGDGIDSNGWIVVNGGTVTSAACGSSGDGGIDADMGIYLNGGTVTASGNMYDQIDGSGENFVVLSFQTRQAGGTAVTLKDAAGKTVATLAPVNDYSLIVYAAPGLAEGDYTLWQGDTQLTGVTGSSMGGRPVGFGGMGTPPEGFDPSQAPGERPQRPDGQQPVEGEQPPALPEGMTPPDGEPPVAGQQPPEKEQPSAGERPDFRPGNRGQQESGPRTATLHIQAGANFFSSISSEAADEAGVSGVSSDSWYSDAAKWACEKGLMSDGNDFSPQSGLTRLEAVEALWAMAGHPVVNYAMSFSDVTGEEPWAEAVRWAVSEKIEAGRGSGVFGAEDVLTREDFATALYRYAQTKGQGFTGAWAFPLRFSDAGQVAETAYEPLCWLTMRKVMLGNGGALNPKSTVTRAQAAVMLQRYNGLSV